jgi:putative transcriptional regulator
MEGGKSTWARSSELRTNPRTLENWEQGRAKPNAQAVLLIRMVSQFQDTMKRLESV